MIWFPKAMGRYPSLACPKLLKFGFKIIDAGSGLTQIDDKLSEPGMDESQSGTSRFQAALKGPVVVSAQDTFQEQFLH